MDINKITSTRKISSTENLQNKQNNKMSISIGEEINGIKIDGKIGEFAQGNFGTCTFLSMLLSLSFTDWGKEVIDNAIDSDGNGGAYVTYYDEYGNADTIHITNNELVEAKSKGSICDQMNTTEFEKLKQTIVKYGNRSQEYEELMADYKKKYKGYTIGDDDVLAFEMALEKKLKKDHDKASKILEPMYRLLGSLDTPSRIVKQSNPEDLLNSDYYHFYTRNGFRLLNGDKNITYFDDRFMYDLGEEQIFNPKSKKVILDYIENKLTTEKITAYASFKTDSVIRTNSPIYQKLPSFVSKDTIEKIKEDEFYESVITTHAYAIKEIRTADNNEKFVVMVNPHDTRKEIVMPYDLFLKETFTIQICGNINLKDEVYKHIDNEISDVNLEAIYEETELNRNINVARKLFNDFFNTLETATSEQHLMNTNEFFKYYNGIPEKLKDDDAMYIVLEENVEKLVNTIDNMYYGWGKGETKKDFLWPIIENIANKALKFGNPETVSTCKEKCIKELDAMFYTDEKVIIENLKQMLNIIIEAQKGGVNKE